MWDLFRQGIVTLGLNAANPGWPWLQLSRFGEDALQHSPYRIHDAAGFMKRLHSEVTDLSPDAVLYIQSVIGIARNESGRPPEANPPSRDHVYVYLQLFIPFARQLMRLRHALSEPAFPRLVRAP